MHENNSIVSEMPSWKVHRALYEKLSREVEDFFVETPGLLDRIDRIIDREYGEYDLGRRADPWSLGKELLPLIRLYPTFFKNMFKYKALRTFELILNSRKGVFIHHFHGERSG